MTNPNTAESNLEQELRKVVRGGVCFDKIHRYLYSTDASAYQIMPLGVVMPLDADDVSAVVEIVSRFDVPITARGGGTSLSGQAIGPGVVIDYSRYMDHISEINVEEQWVQVEPGVVVDNLNGALRQYGMMLGPDPASSASATIGGVVGNNAAGSHSIQYGMTLDHVKDVEVVLADGSQVFLSPQNLTSVLSLSKKETLEGKLYREIPALIETYREDIMTSYPKVWRNVAGYNLNRILADMQAGRPLNLASLIVGSEGTLANVVSARLKIVQRPRVNHLVILHFETLKATLESVPRVLESKPVAVELLNRFMLDLTRQNAKFGPIQDLFVRGNPEAILIVEFSGEKEAVVQAQVKTLETILVKMKYQQPLVQITDPDNIANVWMVRKAQLGLISSKRGDEKPVSFMDDAAVPVEELYDFATEVDQVCRDEGTEASFTAHASVGCLHITPVVNLKTVEGLNRMRRLSEAIAGIAIAHHGTSSGEHGEGISRGYLNEKVFGPRLHQAFITLKTIFDPQDRMNPGKILNTPLPWDPQYLRINPEYKTPLAYKNTYFDFSIDRGFSGAVEMCNGQGTCRRLDVGLMCPSYRVKRDEQSATRGRANILRAAMTGKLGLDGMTSREVYELLDLCLMCKACKKECPSLVDMAKLKSEFLAHYYEKHGMPLRNLAFGYIGTINHLAGLVPGLANWGYNNSILRNAMESIIGIERQRKMPLLASQSFQHWFYHRKTPPLGERGIVIFWDDCFTSYNTPEIGQAAVRVLEAAGYEVRILKDRHCCGRPMISKGLLKQAKRNAAHNVDLLAPYAAQGISIVGVEPSCITSFRDEYPDLVDNKAAQIVADHCFFIDEFITNLAKRAELNLSFKQVKNKRKILLHGQCIQKSSSSGTAPAMEMLRLLPEVEVEEIPSGCCGMAGSFGFEKEHYQMSMAIGEQILFPEIRAAALDTIIAAMGTSCRGQITDGTGRQALHPIMIMAENLL